MSSRGSDYSTRKHLQWVVCMGDFGMLRDALAKKKAEKRSFFWTLIGLIDSLLRGFGQVILANNPISGALIIGVLASTFPGVLLSGIATGFLGLLISMLIRGSQMDVENGLTVYNPLLIGAVTYSLFPKEYGAWDSFAILVTLVSAIISVYLTRSFVNGKLPCVTWPFNVVEIILLLILMMQASEHPAVDVVRANSSEITQDKILVGTDPDWGMVFRGIVTSSSQVFAVDNVAVGSVIYLAILIYSPATAAFSLAGAFIGTLSALGFGIPYDSIYAGLWGYNSLLSCSLLGGILIVLNEQTVPLVFVGGVFTVLLQYVLQHFFKSIQLPVLTVPFVIATWLFSGLRDSLVDNSFPRPAIATFPEDMRFHFLQTNQRNLNARESNVIEGNHEQTPASILPESNLSKSF